MGSKNSAELSLRWCFHLVDALVHGEVRHAFISPGSRSTPLALALVHHPGMICHSVLDERVATFMALGAGKESHIPALFACTSGTAAANAFPAVVEARMSGSPLIVLTADRPPNIRATGSSQSIDQVKLFGDYPFFFFDAGEPVDTPEDFRRLSLLGVQAVEQSCTKGGPVHLNLPFRKPLEPSPQQIKQCKNFYTSDYLSSRTAKDRIFYNPHPDAHALRGPARRSLPGPATQTLTGLHCVILREELRPLPVGWKESFATFRRPLVLAGPGFRSGDPSALRFTEWCRRHRVPVLGETGGIAASITKHPLLLGHRELLEQLAPDVLLRTGGDPVHGPTLTALKKWDVPQMVFPDQSGLSDASLSASHSMAGPAGSYDWDSFSVETPSWDSYFDLWTRHSLQAETEQHKRLEGEPRFTDGHVYSRLLPLITRNTDVRMVLSNSFPIRDYLLFGPGELINRHPVLLNRGASGIDGVTATAIGSALASGRYTVLFTGDLAFLHDTTALNNLMSREIKLKIVVVNNGGGILFRMLPFEDHDQTYYEFFETPQQVTLSEIAKAHALPFESVDASDQLQSAWERLDASRIGVLECRTDPKASMNLRSTI